MEREYSHLLAWSTYTWIALSSTCMGLLQGLPTLQICSSKMGVSISVYECPPTPAVHFMDAKYSQLPSMCHSAAVPAQGGPVGSGAQQAARQGTECPSPLLAGTLVSP